MKITLKNSFSPVYVVLHESLFVKFSFMQAHSYMHGKLFRKKNEKTHKRKKSRIAISLSRRWKISFHTVAVTVAGEKDEFIKHKTRKYY